MRRLGERPHLWSVGLVGAVRAACQVVFAVLVLGPVAAWADQPNGEPAQSGEEARSAQRGLWLKVVVTATRREEGLSKVPISVTALTQEAMDIRGHQGLPGRRALHARRQHRQLRHQQHLHPRHRLDRRRRHHRHLHRRHADPDARAGFNPDEALPKSFDLDRVEVLRGPQGTLFGAGSEGGTVRYITTQPSLTKTEHLQPRRVSYTEGGAPSYEAGVAAGGPIIDGTLGVRATVWYRRDGGWIDRIDPVHARTPCRRTPTTTRRAGAAGGIWAPNDNWTRTPSIYYQNRELQRCLDNYWPLYSNPGSDSFVNADPDAALATRTSSICRR